MDTDAVMSFKEAVGEIASVIWLRSLSKEEENQLYELVGNIYGKDEKEVRRHVQQILVDSGF